MTLLVKVNNVSKRYNSHSALNNINLELQAGQVLGLLGHNGAGKSSLINALLGAHSYQGDIEINGCHPIKQHKELMTSLAYISDVNVLPHWMSVQQILKYTAGVHPCFDKQAALKLLEQTNIGLKSKIGSLSKGMKVQLHLALIIATDSKVLILDEPTLGLDLIYRETFYRHLLEWFHDGERCLIIASHEVAEIEPLLTDVLILKQGQQRLCDSLDNLSQNYFMLTAPDQHSEQIQLCQPLSKTTCLGGNRWLLNSQHQAALSHLGETSLASLTDIFLALQQEAK